MGELKRAHLRNESEDGSRPDHPRSIHEMTCFDRHAKLAADGHRKCLECGEDLRPLMDGKKKR